MTRPAFLGLAVYLLSACGARSGLETPDDVDASPSDAPIVETDPAPPVKPTPLPSRAPPPPPPPGRPPPADELPRADRMDLLFVVDDSGSMGDKQQILARAVPDWIQRLTNPLCVDGRNTPVPLQPGGALEPCPSGAHREFNPVQDLHVGVVTSSLEIGAAGCGPGTSARGAQGHLVLPSSVPSYDGSGFLAWDPAGTKSPPGEADSATFRDAVSLAMGAGEGGCVYEAPLEAWYRFLVDPEPYAEVVRVDCEAGSGLADCAALSGVDRDLLAERARFLRYDSLVAIVLLSDENDCSLRPGGLSYLLHEQVALPRATSACTSDSNSPCCRSCGQPQKAGCPEIATDLECQKGLLGVDQAPGVFRRCYETKRTYGVDFFHPTERYAKALLGEDVPDRDGTLVKNPLYVDPTGKAPPRDPSLVYFAAVVGVPWQDLARNPSDRERLDYKTADEMHADGTWSVIVGDSSSGVLPTDPLMIESIEPRTGVTPVTGEALAPPTAARPWENRINGHEFLAGPTSNELQYACIFDLPEPRDCSSGFFCDCSLDLQASFGDSMKPTCQAEDGTYGSVQFRGKAYPGLRELAVLRDIGDRAIVGSICARNVTDPSRDDFGYRPALAAILERLRVGLE